MPHDLSARRAALIREHPSETPELTGEPTGLCDPPSIFRENARFIRFRDETVIPAMQADPDNPNWPRWLEQIERILAWRATIPAELRFWRADA